MVAPKDCVKDPAPQSVHDVIPTLLVYFPAGHSRHEVPDTYVPTWHVLIATAPSEDMYPPAYLVGAAPNIAVSQLE